MNRFYPFGSVKGACVYYSSLITLPLTHCVPSESRVFPDFRVQYADSSPLLAQIIHAGEYGRRRKCPLWAPRIGHPKTHYIMILPLRKSLSWKICVWLPTVRTYLYGSIYATIFFYLYPMPWALILFQSNLDKNRIKKVLVERSI